MNFIEEENEKKLIQDAIMRRKSITSRRRNKNDNNNNSSNNSNYSNNKIEIKTKNNSVIEIIKILPKLPLRFDYLEKRKKRTIILKSPDLLELPDKVDFHYFDDEILLKKLKKTLHQDMNGYPKDNKYYLEYLHNVPLYINFIFDINTLPHLKNKFFFRKNFKNQNEMDKKLTSLNMLEKSIRVSMNRMIININGKQKEKNESNIKNDKIENNKMLTINLIENFFNMELKLKKEIENLDMKNYTYTETSELIDFFSKSADYEDVQIAKNQFKEIVFYKFN